MLEFFDVPSPLIGTIGPVAQGQNFDWWRQDRKPGQLNINLIIDEEVFLGLIDDYSRLNTNLATASAPVPLICQGLDATGAPITVSMSNRGYFDTNTGVTGMKAAFSDFLKLRHGGSLFPQTVAGSTVNFSVLFGYGSGAVGTPLPIERPFHSLSYPDIDFTMMRPATLPPPSQPTSSFPNPSPPDPTNPSFVAIDPGVKNGTFSMPGSGQPPAIPPRRLWEIPDFLNNTAPTPPSTLNIPGSNASESGDYRVNTPIQHPFLSNPAADLSAPPNASATPPNIWLGANTVAGGVIDRRQHPYFRTEWLQKMMNNTTTRTHQYAVWITVGFFEVKKVGNEQTATPDQLGPEIGAASGRNLRFRSFFLIDRTRAIGFNPSDPGDFRDCVVYRSRIE